MKGFLIQLGLIFVIVLTCIFISKCEHDQINEINRLRKNEAEISNFNKNCDSINHITDVSLLQSGSKKETNLLLTNQEKKAIKKIGASEKRLKEITTLQTITKVDTFIKIDTFIKHDTIIPTFYFNDDFCSFAGRVEDGYVTFDLSLKDSINIIAHRVPRKFLFFKFGTKAVDLEVYNTNPYSLVKSARRINVQR